MLNNLQMLKFSTYCWKSTPFNEVPSKRFDNFRKVVKSEIWQLSKSCQIWTKKDLTTFKKLSNLNQERFDNFRKVVKSET